MSRTMAPRREPTPRRAGELTDADRSSRPAGALQVPGSGSGNTDCRSVSWPEWLPRRAASKEWSGTPADSTGSGCPASTKGAARSASVCQSG